MKKSVENSLLVNKNLESNNLEIISKDATGQTVGKDVRKDNKIIEKDPLNEFKNLKSILRI